MGTWSIIPLFGIDFEATNTMNSQGRGDTLFRSDVESDCTGGWRTPVRFSAAKGDKSLL